MDDVTNEQVAEMAMAACDAALGKAEELGLDPMAHVLGIERAYEVTKKVLLLFTLLGPDTCHALAEAIRKAMAHDMMAEAEETLERGE